MNDNGDLTIIQFRQFIEKYPYSEYTDDAEMKIGEYLYARGLYGQASQQLKKITLKYKNSNHIQRSVDLSSLDCIFNNQFSGVQDRHAKSRYLNQKPTLESCVLKVCGTYGGVPSGPNTTIHDKHEPESAPSS